MLWTAQLSYWNMGFSGTCRTKTPLPIDKKKFAKLINSVRPLKEPEWIKTGWQVHSFTFYSSRTVLRTNSLNRFARPIAQTTPLYSLRFYQTLFGGPKSKRAIFKQSRSNGLRIVQDVQSTFREHNWSSANQKTENIIFKKASVLYRVAQTTSLMTALKHQT